jgi:hypothetical protein
LESLAASPRTNDRGRLCAASSLRPRSSPSLREVALGRISPLVFGLAGSGASSVSRGTSLARCSRTTPSPGRQPR